MTNDMILCIPLITIPFTTNSIHYLDIFHIQFVQKTFHLIIAANLFIYFDLLLVYTMHSFLFLGFFLKPLLLVHNTSTHYSN